MNILTKEFSLGDVLSVTTGRLVSERHMDGVYDILNWMTGDSLFTHQLPRAGEACRPVLAAQFPQLDPEDNPELMFAVGELIEMLETPSGKAEREMLIAGWLIRLKAKYGETFNVVPLAAWTHKDPIEELRELAPGVEIITVNTPDTDTFPATL